jgi:hypothetical protein
MPSFVVHIEPKTEARLQEVHQLAMQRFGKFMSFDQLIHNALGAYGSVCKTHIKLGEKE